MSSPFPSRRELRQGSINSAESDFLESAVTLGGGEGSRETLEATSLGRNREPIDKAPSLFDKGADHIRGRLVSLTPVNWEVALWPVAAAVLAVLLLLIGAVVNRSATQEVLTVEMPLDPVSVSGRVGAAPVVDLAEPLELNSSKVRTEVYGQGRVIEEGTPVLLSLSTFDGETGETKTAGGRPSLLLESATPEALGETLNEVVIGKAEGSRILVARPLEDGTVELNVVDVLSSIAVGKETDEKGPLKVSWTEAGPKISHKKTPPDSLTVQRLIEGEGGQVHAEDELVLQYYAIEWGKKEPLTSTWGAGSPSRVQMEAMMPGVSEALIDQRVGSRLAVTVPPEMATGDDTLIIVVDILAAIPSSEEEKDKDVTDEDSQ